MQQISEPCGAGHHVGDAVPCHFFFPEVWLSEPLPPVVRQDKAKTRQQQWMQPPVQPWIAEAAAEARSRRRWLWLMALFTVLCDAVLILLIVGITKAYAAPVVVVRAPVVARPAPSVTRPAPPRPVVHVPAPVVSPSLAKPPVRCERDGLGQCVGVQR